MKERVVNIYDGDWDQFKYKSCSRGFCLIVALSNLCLCEKLRANVVFWPYGRMDFVQGGGQEFELGYLARRRKEDSVGNVQGFDMAV